MSSDSKRRKEGDGDDSVDNAVRDENAGDSEYVRGAVVSIRMRDFVSGLVRSCRFPSYLCELFHPLQFSAIV